MMRHYLKRDELVIIIIIAYGHQSYYTKHF